MIHFKINCGTTDEVGKRLEDWADKSCKDYQLVETNNGGKYLFIQRVQETTIKQLRKNLLTMLSHSKLPSPGNNTDDPFVIEIPESEFLKQFSYNVEPGCASLC